MRRGNLLWTGSRMMLSEHRQLLNELLREEQIEDDLIRELDQQQLEEWQEILNRAIANHQEIIVTIGYKEKKQLIGRIVTWDVEQGDLYLQIEEDERIRVLAKQIIDLKLR
ncbi:hypothetical protein BHF71_07435 [Vulcanibacillus modesticaldus]|uniref:YolD-like family protein n=1 Tax=Vulcanibacillus modesticaldus TaxID=337097 RepID=A0A1D2YW96_9BACI|nr:YolD-like family protein [Vulcanibacillus modesticaldus]OEF99932.1 hypothetical protein BHF71_07435 [Vulcanibacillus modesticaldus]